MSRGGQNKIRPKSTPTTVPASPSAAMHAARTYIEYYQLSRYGSYHAVNISHMYGTDSVPFLQGELRETEREIRTRRAAPKSTRGLTHSRHIIILISLITVLTNPDNQDSF